MVDTASQAQKEFTTPMMQQYMKIKKEYSEYLLFYRLGDFYELFLDDALVGAQALQITLTRRPRGKDGDIPMAGVPYHAADRYISKLVKAGYKVAICEQVSEPDNRGIVEREVVRLITPGTVLDEQALNGKENNFIMAFAFSDKKVGIAAADISTGVFECAQFSSEDAFSSKIADILLRFAPAECLLSDASYNKPEILHALRSVSKANITCIHEWDLYSSQAQEKLKKHFKVSTLKQFAVHDQIYGLEAAAVLLAYVKETQKGQVHHMSSLRKYDSENYVVIDASSQSNLELFSTLHENKRDGSLIGLLDQTMTAMGGRLLRQWIKQPLCDIKVLRQRHDHVELLYKQHENRIHVRELLQSIYDIERIIARLSTGIGNAADLVNLKNSIRVILHINDYLKNATIFNISKEERTTLADLQTYINVRIVDMPPIDVRGGGLIKEGVHKELDELRDSLSGNKEWMVQFEEMERIATGITTLKVRFNKVFGYYIEISNAHANRAPKHYTRKQTLVNAERFVTPELKEYEIKILNAEEHADDIEYKLLQETISTILLHVQELQKISLSIAYLDCVSTFAHLADLYHYSKPDMHEKGTLHIVDGRHPVVERLLEGNHFVPNSTFLDQDSNQLHIITGPNMAGKSVYMRQIALITLMAHIGSFVPARSASISMVDRIFVRSGASDFITSGLSTFMIEMVETAHIIHYATPKSLVILDEVGRGTSTYDGMSIAWAVSEYLVTHWKKGPKTLFATHYHELQELEKKFSSHIKNFHMAIEDHKGSPIFLYTIVGGPASHSYGIAVAQLAGIPDTIIIKAQSILRSLEQQQGTSDNGKDQSLAQRIRSLDVNTLTPMEALSYLTELQKKLLR